MNTTLEEHIQISQSVYSLLLEENRVLKETGALPGAEMLQKKRHLLDRLSESLARMKKETVKPGISSLERRNLVEKAQQIILKTLLQDRENEQLAQKHAMYAPTGRKDLTLPFAHLQQVYKKHLPAKSSHAKETVKQPPKNNEPIAHAASFKRPHPDPS